MPSLQRKVTKEVLEIYISHQKHQAPIIAIGFPYKVTEVSFNSPLLRKKRKGWKGG